MLMAATASAIAVTVQTPAVVPAQAPVTAAVSTHQVRPIGDRHVLSPGVGTKRKVVSVGNSVSLLERDAGPAKKFCGVDLRILALREEEEEDSESDTSGDEGCSSGRGG